MVLQSRSGVGSPSYGASAPAALSLISDNKKIKTTTCCMCSEIGRLSWAEAQAYYRRGHTLLLRYAEMPSAKLQALAEEFAHFVYA